MGTHADSDPTLRSRATHVLFSPLALVAALLCWGAPQAARAFDRDVTLEFMPPQSGEVAGYNVYVTDEGSGELRLFDTGHVPPDADGIARTIVVLATENAYRVTMTSYGGGGESVASNALLISAESVCDPSRCDDDDPCTLNSCDARGCIAEPAPDGTRCDDDFIDTIDDQCRAGTCEGILLVCSDDFDCEDETVCNGAESCDGGEICLSGTPLDCRAEGPCQVPSCDPVLGCQVENRPDGSACNDGQSDTEGDVCVAGFCEGVASGGDAPVLSLDQISPDRVARGRHTLALAGSGFQVGTRFELANGMGPAPKLRSLRLVDESRLEADIEVSKRGPKRTIYWDVVVTLPDGTTARIPQGLATMK